MKETIKCISCGEKFIFDPLCNTSITEKGEKIGIELTDEWCLGGEGKFICEWCKESEEQSLTTIIKYKDDKGYVAKIGEYVAYILLDGEYSTTGVELQEAHSIAKYRVWKSIDAWRGYYCLEDTNTQFKSIINGWVTGYPDSTVRYKEFSCQLYEYLEKKGSPIPIWWVFSPTSNLFSTSVNIIVLEENEAEFWNWIKWKFKKSPSEVQDAFL